MSVIIQGNTVIQGRTMVNGLLLNQFPNAAAAYSLRRINITYTGSAIRVRRSSDNTEQDIGFDGSGNLDETALTTFVGAGNGFVTKWYDQSTNVRDAAQTTQASQPRIVNAGVVDKVNGNPSIFIDGSNDFLTFTDTSFKSQSQISFVNVISPSVSQAADTIGMQRFSIGDSNGGANGGWFALSNNTGLLTGEKVTFYWFKTLPLPSTNGRLGASTYDFNSGSQYLEFFTNQTTLTALYKNGVQATLNLSAAITTTSNNTPSNSDIISNTMYIGGYLNNGVFTSGAAGYFSEWIVWYGANYQGNNRTAIENNINAYYNIY